MRTKTESRTKRLRDLVAGDVIEIDQSGHLAVVSANEPDSDPGFRRRGFYQTRFDMGAPHGIGGWTGNGQNMVTLAAPSIGGAR